MDVTALLRPDLVRIQSLGTNRSSAPLYSTAIEEEWDYGRAIRLFREAGR
jgi:hypothetical protein